MTPMLRRLSDQFSDQAPRLRRISDRLSNQARETAGNLYGTAVAHPKATAGLLVGAAVAATAVWLMVTYVPRYLSRRKAAQRVRPMHTARRGRRVRAGRAAA